MSDIIVPGSFEICFDAQLIVVFQFHGSVRVEASSEVMHSLLQFRGTFSLFYYKYFWEFLLQFKLVFVTSRFFLYLTYLTLRPPTLGILYIITYQQSVHHSYRIILFFIIFDWLKLRWRSLLLLRDLEQFSMMLCSVANMFLAILSIKFFFLAETESDLLENELWSMLSSGLNLYFDFDKILL